MGATNPLVSVVTPVYNGEKYLRECIESVLAQTYGRWDHTIVNNCSTDGTLAIATEYAQRDSRIRIHNNADFLRVIANHNMALRLASPESKYCKPLAADDVLLPECLEEMVRVAESHPTVGFVGSYSISSRAEQGVFGSGVPYGQELLPGRELCRGYLLGRGPAVWGAPTYVLIRGDLVRSREAFYNESNLHADSEACLEFLESTDFGFVHRILTQWRAPEGTLTSLSIRLNTYLPHRLLVLAKYGPKYLTEEELAECIATHLREYYRYLGRQVSKRREREFWEFHRRKLADLGYPMNRGRVAAHAIAYLMDVVLNPKRTAEAAIALARDYSRSRRQVTNRSSVP